MRRTSPQRVIGFTEGGDPWPNGQRYLSGMTRGGVRRSDWAVALAALVIGEQETWLPIGPGFSSPVGPRVVLALTLGIVAGVLLWRRRSPLAAVGIINAVLVLYYLAYGAPDGLATDVPCVAALYATGRYSTVRRLLLATAITSIGMAAHTWKDPRPSLPVGPTILFWVATLGSGVLGLLLANRSRTIRTLATTADLLRRERDLEAREAVTAERSRIARELHDLVGHGISLMILQTEGAQAVAASGNLEAVTGRLDRLSTTARQTMTEMRRLLSVVGDEPASLHPEPGISEIGSLVERLRIEGVPIEFTVEPADAVIPASIGIATYRVVQEALTNVAKHAGPGTPTRVLIRSDPERIAIEVIDHGPRMAHSPIVGRGLSGMRERVAVFGGELRFGPCAEGGFELRASFPLSRLAP